MAYKRKLSSYLDVWIYVYCLAIRICLMFIFVVSFFLYALSVNFPSLVSCILKCIALFQVKSLEKNQCCRSGLGF